MKRITALTIFLALTQTACVAVGGYTSGGGWFFWPGSLGLIVVIALLYLLFGRRGR